MTFDAAYKTLHDFYVLSATGSATLVGLLFVGLSLHLRTVIAVAEVRSLARFTLSNFGTVLFASMFLVINEGEMTNGYQLIGIALVTMVVVSSSVASLFRGTQRLTRNRADRVRILLRFGSSAVGYVAVGAAGVLLLANQVALFMLVIEVSFVLLLVVSLRNTWDLLVTVAEASGGKDS